MLLLSSRGRSGLLSLAIHAAALTLLLLIGISTPQRSWTSKDTLHFIPLASPVVRAQMNSGGGGGQRSPTPPSKGRLPRLARVQFVPPIIRTNPVQAKLVVEPTLVVSADIHVPATPLPIGDPNGIPGPPSGGPGSGGGIGDGPGTGIGHRRGPGYGDGDKGVASIVGPGVSRPVLLWKIDPDYSEEARKARFQGAVMLRVDIGVDGRPQNIRVAEPLGLGLDEKAIEAVRQWKFRPGMRNGRPVVMSALVEVHFRLL